MNEKYKRYLPLGSVVLLKNAKKRIMITGYSLQSPESGERIWDYTGCLWPEGVISSDKTLLFDHGDINQIFAIGYSDEEQKKFMVALDKATELSSNKASN